MVLILILLLCHNRSRHTYKRHLAYERQMTTDALLSWIFYYSKGSISFSGLGIIVG